MAMRRLNGLADVAELNEGAVDAIFKRALLQCVNDATDRPADGSARTITVQLSLTPVSGSEGILEEIQVGVQVKHSLPKQHTRSISMIPDAPSGGLSFNDLAPENARQRTLDEQA